MNQEEIKNKVTESLKEIADPELGYDIVKLGLIRSIELGDYLEDFKVYDFVRINMTLTSIMCPFADQIIESVKEKVDLLNFGEPEVKLDFTEPWEPSEELRIELGL